MTRSLLAIVAGYLTISGLSALIRTIIWLGFGNNLSLTGIEKLPAEYWIYAITAFQFGLGLLGGLVASYIAKSDTHIAILGFILLMIAVGLIDYSMLNEREPLWYLITSPLLKVLGIFAGYRLKNSRNKR